MKFLKYFALSGFVAANNALIFQAIHENKIDALKSKFFLFLLS